MPLEAIELPAPRLQPPDSLAEIVSDDRRERVSHALGKAYRDVVRGFRGEIPNPPDLVARPRDESEVAQVLEWCADAGAAAIPYGGGTSVVGGVEPRLDADYEGAVTLDIGALDRVLEVDEVSRAARIQAGTLGPSLNEQLAAHGLTLRHFPQSFEYSTLGGWIATRAGGHFATVWTHIDDLVESVRAITPVGAWESRRLPGSGAGPSPDRMLIGSEGILGVITEAWVRVHESTRAQALGRGRIRLVRRGRRGGAGAGAVGAQPGQLPAARRGRVAAHACRRARPGDPGARLRVRPPPGRRADGAGARMRARPWRRGGRGAGQTRRGQRAAGRCRGCVAACVSRCALPARYVRRRRGALRHLRDRDHLGSLRRLPRHRDRDRAPRPPPGRPRPRRTARRRRR